MTISPPDRDGIARAYADGWEAGYQDGYDDGAADAHASDPDPGPMDEDTARVQVVQVAGAEAIRQGFQDISRAWAEPEPLPLPAGPDYPRERRTSRRHTPDLLREVARVYWQAGPDALPYERMDAVAEKYGVHRTTAGRYIRDARLAGILPPDPPPIRHRPRPPHDEPNPW